MERIKLYATVHIPIETEVEINDHFANALALGELAPSALNTIYIENIYAEMKKQNLKGLAIIDGFDFVSKEGDKCES